MCRCLLHFRKAERFLNMSEFSSFSTIGQKKYEGSQIDEAIISKASAGNTTANSNCRPCKVKNAQALVGWHLVSWNAIPISEDAPAEIFTKAKELMDNVQNEEQKGKHYLVFSPFGKNYRLGDVWDLRLDGNEREKVLNAPPRHRGNKQERKADGERTYSS